MKSLRTLGSALLMTAGAFAQAGPARLEFEVASVKPAEPLVAGGQFAAGVKVDGAQVHIHSLALSSYIESAFKLKNYQVEGPSWLTAERFDIDAKLPAGGTREQVGEMLQSLLADRFELKYHRETKDFPVYGLVIAKGGLKMKAIPVDEDEAKGNVDVTMQGAQGGTNVNLGHGSSFSLSMADNSIIGVRLTTKQIADLLARFADRPVVDMTDLTGAYTFTMKFTPEDFRPMMIRAAIAGGVSLPPEAMRLLDGASNDGLFAVLQTLGLKLENRKAPLEMLVVDHVLKTPKEN